MCEDIRQYAITRMAVKRQCAMKWKNICAPKIIAKIKKGKEKMFKLPCRME